jgi:hypothetical protein
MAARQTVPTAAAVSASELIDAVNKHMEEAKAALGVALCRAGNATAAAQRLANTTRLALHTRIDLQQQRNVTTNAALTSSSNDTPPQPSPPAVEAKSPSRSVTVFKTENVLAVRRVTSPLRPPAFEDDVVYHVERRPASSSIDGVSFVPHHLTPLSSIGREERSPSPNRPEPLPKPKRFAGPRQPVASTTISSDQPKHRSQRPLATERVLALGGSDSAASNLSTSVATTSVTSRPDQQRDHGGEVRNPNSADHADSAKRHTTVVVNETVLPTTPPQRERTPASDLCLAVWSLEKSKELDSIVESFPSPSRSKASASPPRGLSRHRDPANYV